MVSSLSGLYTCIDTVFAEFVNGLNASPSSYQHLEFTRCASVSVMSRNLEDMFSHTYTGLFNSGFELTSCDNFDERAKEFIKSTARPCIHDSNRKQLAVLDQEVLDLQMNEWGLTDEQARSQVSKLFKDTTMRNAKIRTYLVGYHPVRSPYSTLGTRLVSRVCN